jgi:hypothetical protein
MRTVLLVALFALLAMPAQAQTNDSRWEPWLGCWVLVVDNLTAGNPNDASPRRPTRPNIEREDSPRVCVTPASGGARLETSVAGRPPIEQTIIADATQHAVADDECSGTQRAEWSKNGLRLFSSAEISCKGDEGLRRVSGMSLIARNGDWLDIQAVTIGGRETVRVKRYFRDPDAPRRERPSVAASALTLEEVTEASTKVASPAVEAALVETNAGFNLTAKKLIELDASGLPDRVMDLIVALSYPDKFNIRRVAQEGPDGETTFVRDPFLSAWGYGSPYYYDGYYSSYFYEPFGYRGYAAVRYVPIYVTPGGGGSGGGSVIGTGRVVNGQGYTRIEPRAPVSDSGSGFGRAVAAARGSGGGSGGGAGAGSASSGSSGGSSSSGSSGGGGGGSGGGSVSSGGGYSSGGGSDTGRTAIPR